METDTSKAQAELHPFDDPDADLILHTCDRVRFRVFRLVLSLASPVFKDMLSLPQPTVSANGGGEDGVPVVDVAEDRHTLDLLLRFCYPMEGPSIETLDDVRLLLAAGQKYDMPRPVAAGRVRLREFVDTDPVGAWAVAMNQNLHDEARFAARQCLSRPMLAPDGDLECSPQLRGVSGEDHLHLVRYYLACAQVTSQLGISRWVPADCAFLQCRSSDCKSRQNTEPSTPRDWWYDFMLTAASWLRDAPRGSTVDSQMAWKICVEKGTKCSDCRNTIHKDVPQFLNAFAAKIEEEIDKINLVV